MVREGLCFKLLELMHQRQPPKCHGIDKGDKVYTKESCFEFGLDAKWFLRRQLQCAHSIYIQRSGFTDQYNRRIARLLVKYNENANEKVDLA